MHNGMQYDTIQGQDHEPFRVGNLFHFQKLSSSAIFMGFLQLTTDYETRAQYLNLIGPDFLYLAWFLCHVTLNLA